MKPSEPRANDMAQQNQELNDLNESGRIGATETRQEQFRHPLEEREDHDHRAGDARLQRGKGGKRGALPPPQPRVQRAAPGYAHQKGQEHGGEGVGRAPWPRP